ncbi:OLC1v1002504C4 [Oldenlandia corymbosa var. corymbosa]|uniref:OLC1v1002504C4 n=1 Tax=Oldenlandia corymbosa var. corymbosa TaxID=529605 RepID=A0AAV1D9E1_OLDCO|nr:OLC1v1002504C4 [Oldenlandia corymbosa var. corymbosa]
MNSISESSLLSKIESSTDIPELHTLFFNYLQPFKTVSGPKKPSSKSSKTPETATIRSLAKQFISFLNKSLSLLPKRLSSEAGSSSPDKISRDCALKLFEVYRLCLNCLSLIVPVLECKPHAIQVQQVRLVHCLDSWGLHQEAQTECFVVLESLRSISGDKVRTKSAKSKGQLLPRLNEENVDQDYALLVVEIVIILIKCASIIQSEDERDYKRVIAMVHESKPWCKVLNGNSYDNLHRTLVAYLNRLCIHLVKGLEVFDIELVLEFCELTLTLISESFLKDQICKYAWGICYSLFSKKSSGVLHISEVLKFVLSFLAAACEFKVEQTITEFLEVVQNCARSCKTATPTICNEVGEHLSKLAGSQDTLLVGAIMGVYASGLLISSSECQSIIGECATERNAENGSISGAVHGFAVLLKRLHVYLESMRGFFNFSDNGNRLSKEKTSYLLSYYDALKFFCLPLARSVYAQRKEILAEGKNAESFANLGVIHDAFYQLCSIVILLTRAGEKINVPVEYAWDGMFKVMHDVPVAAFTLSLQNGHRIKESANLVKYVLSSDRIQADGLKYIFSSLYNVYVIQHRNKHLEKASKALKLSCMASWKLLMLYCKSHELHGDLSEVNNKAFRKDAMGYVNEASEKTAILLDLLSERSHHKMKKLLKSSLESWCVAESMLQNISPPFALVKRWVKIGHKVRQNKDSEHSSITLYNLLSSSDIVSEKALGVLLEQELLAYKSGGALDSIFSSKMRMEIIEILLEKLYGSNDTCVEKSRVLIAKAGELRDLGSENLDECFQCLSEAISILEMCSSNHKCHKCDIEARHLRACAHCLRALCTLEKSMQKSKVLLLKSNFEDVRSALNLWFHPFQDHSTDHCSTLDGIFKFFNDNGHSNMFFENMLKMLHCLLDLLSMQGYMEMHAEIYEIIVRLFKWKNLSLEDALALFWKSRSFGHGLCASPFSEIIISKLSHCYGEQSKSIRFWIKSMQPSRALLIGFQQRFFSSLPDSSLRNFYEGDMKVAHDEVRSGASGSPFHVSAEDVKHVVSDLLSSVPVSGNSFFLAAYLYYDLSDRLIMKGKVTEALLYAKEAYQWRYDLLRKKFKYSVRAMSDSENETEDGSRRHFDILASIQLRDSVAKEVWFGCPPCDIEGCILTPWNILKCYLDSTLQVSKINEILGEASKAEALLQWGKQIAVHRCLPVYVIFFSSMLGKLYRKQMLWRLAEKELKAASQMMADNKNMITCLKCRMFLDSTICHQLGDLYKSHSCNDMGNPSSAMANYRSALQKLNIVEWDDFSSNFEDGKTEQIDHRDRSSFFGCLRDALDKVVLPSKSERPAGKIQKKKAQKKGKKPSPPHEQCLVAGHNLRMTRSRYRSLEKSGDAIFQNIECGPVVNSHNGSSYSRNCEPDGIDVASEAETSIAECAYEITRLSNKIKCWHCLVLEALKSGSVTDFVHLNWELVRRRVSWQLLIKIGKSFGAYDDNHKAHQIVLLSVSLLVNPFCGKYSSVSWSSLIDMLNEDFLRDIFAVEHAVLLYSICWIALRSYADKITSRENHCQISTIGIPRIFSWLKLAFMLSCEVPILSQKVSRLLSVIYLLSTSVKAFSLQRGEALSENYWASFFHQASIGIHFNQRVLSSMMQKTKSGKMDSCLSSSDSGFLRALNSLRLTPEALSDMGEFVSRFFEGLPSSTIICVSVIGGAEAILLRELLCCASARAWILVSRLNSKDQPVILLRPMDSLLQESSIVDLGSNSGISKEDQDLVKQWKCPWNSSIVDEIAPAFKTIMKENYSSSAFQTEDKLLWWSQRKSLDKCLGRFLQNLEDSWLGPWKFLLLEKCADTNHMVSLENKLIEDLKLKCKVNVPKDLLRVFLRGASCSSEIRECALQLILNKGCYIGGCCEAVSNASVEVKSLSIEVFKTVSRTDALGEIDSLTPKPVILVLDSEVQMLPWESLPILRDEEIYRMPSVSSIRATLDRCHEIFPVIDPLDSFYVLNPSGDLSKTQFEFEKWFKDQKIEVDMCVLPVRA